MRYYFAGNIICMRHWFNLAPDNICDVCFAAILGIEIFPLRLDLREIIFSALISSPDQVICFDLFA